MHYGDVTTYNYTLYDFIGHPTFQMKKVLVTRNLNQPQDVLCQGAWTAGHETKKYMKKYMKKDIIWCKFVVIWTEGMGSSIDISPSFL